MFFKPQKFPNDGETYIVAGLGNPGTEYEQTRHNTGFMALDVFAAKHNIKIDRLKFKSLCGVGMIGSKRVILIKPSTYMNLSGQAVTEAMAFYKTPPEKTLLIFDDISLPVGRMRIRRRGSDGGHNGVKNIIYLSDSDMFPRIKIGVGSKPPSWELAAWVLSHFTQQETAELQTVFGRAVEAVELILQDNIDAAMNKFSS